MSSSLFVSSLWLFNVLLYVCVNMHNMSMTPARVWLLIHVVFFFLFLHLPLYMCLYVCMFVFPCVRAALWLSLKSGLWSQRWQPTALRRNRPAGWNLGEKLSEGRIIVRRWGQETTRRQPCQTFRRTQPHIRKGKLNLSLIIRRLRGIKVWTVEWQEILLSFLFLSEILYFKQRLSILVSYGEVSYRPNKRHSQYCGNSKILPRSGHVTVIHVGKYKTD